MNLEEEIYDIIVDAQNECYRECAYMDSVKVNTIIAKRLVENGMIMLPCSVGSPVYFIEKHCFACHHYKYGWYNNDFCDREPRGEIHEDDDTDKGCKYKIVEAKFSYSMIDDNEKHRMFLTKEEAEKALEERMNGNAEMSGV